jgi:hypothetical protein
MGSRGNGALAGSRGGGCAARGPRHGDDVPALSSPLTAANGTKHTIRRAWGEEGGGKEEASVDRRCLGGGRRRQGEAGHGKCAEMTVWKAKHGDCRD